MNLSARERRLLIVFGALLVITLLVFLLGRLGGEDVAVEVPEIVFPSSSPSAMVVPTGSPAFVVPVGARDPFKP